MWTTHGLHALRRGVPGIARGTQAALAAARATLCCSQAERDELGGGTVVPNGVDPRPATTPEARAAARAELGLPVEGRVALFLGDLDARKDPLTAARAAQQAGVTLLAAGEGPLRGGARGRRRAGARLPRATSTACSPPPTPSSCRPCARASPSRCWRRWPTASR